MSRSNAGRATDSASTLLQLSDAHREVLVLRFLHELSHVEIASQLGKREDAVRALQSRALRELRRRYGLSA